MPSAASFFLFVFGSAALFFAAGASPAAGSSTFMSFAVTVTPDCRPPCYVVRGSGVIADDTDERFAAAVDGVPGPLEVVLDSPGGTLQGGFNLGVALRERAARVRVPSGATCASACAYAFLGGTARSVEGGRFGVHRHSAEVVMNGRRLDGAERIANAEATTVLRRYVADMGADPELVTLALGVAPAQMRFLTRSELNRYRIVTAPPAVAGRATGAAARGAAAPASRARPAPATGRPIALVPVGK